LTAFSSAAACLPPTLPTSREDIQAVELRASGRWIRRRDLREEAGGGRGRDDEGRDFDGDVDVVHDGVAGDEEEDGVDDLEGEFGLQDGGAGHDDDPQYVAESMLRAQMSYGRGGNAHPSFSPVPNVPLLTNGQMVHTCCSPLPLLLALLAFG
jgi:hypothetical protein